MDSFGTVGCSEAICVPFHFRNRRSGHYCQITGHGSGGAPIGGGGRPQQPPRTIVMEMLRGLPADQFELKVHRENPGERRRHSTA